VRKIERSAVDFRVWPVSRANRGLVSNKWRTTSGLIITTVVSSSATARISAASCPCIPVSPQNSPASMVAISLGLTIDDHLQRYSP
jgi:hypothetical protein